ncbi:NADH-quinone oxidoreductase subunit C [Streptomyces xantholiticus]|uniref:NADH-quinone oxidoreductase subunit C n=1 Tax=Streptomyces xantholiticus TaxID=68285 RepID=A0ABV1URC6_9ACTN
MNPYDSLPDAVTEIFGEEATAERTYELLTVDVPAGSWIAALEIARDKLGCTYFDWLSAVDEPGTGFRVCAHVVSLEGRTVRRLLVRTTVSHTAPSLASAVDVYAGASWHERETHEMFGVDFTGHPNQAPLLLPDGFEGHPLRKDFVLAARVAKAWPGAKEPGESEHGGPKRRQMLPPGVPDPNEWGPLKGQLPPAPARPARTPRAGAAGAAGTGERPARRTRSTSEGSASQEEAAPTGTPRRSRSASEGSASQGEAAAPTGTPRRSRSASEGSASQGEAAAPTGTPRRSRSASEGSASQGEEGTASAPAGSADPAQAPARSGSSDAPWHHARPAFDGADTAAEPSVPTDKPGPEAPGADAPGPKAPAAEAPAPTAPAPDVPAPEASAPTASATDVPAAEAPAPTASATDAPAPEAPDPKTPDPDAVGDPASESESPRPETTRPAPGSADGPDDEPNRPAGGEPA